MKDKKLDNWEKKIKQAFKESGLLIKNPLRCGGEFTIGESRFRLSELFEFISEILTQQRKKNDMKERSEVKNER